MRENEIATTFAIIGVAFVLVICGIALSAAVYGIDVAINQSCAPLGHR